MPWYSYSTWVVLDEGAVQVSQLVSTDVSGRVVRRLEVQVVLPAAEELGGGDVHADDDLVGVAGLLDGRLQQLQSCRPETDGVLLGPGQGLRVGYRGTDRQADGCLTLVVLQDVGGEAALVSHVGGVFSVLRLNHVLQIVVHLNITIQSDK